MLQASDDITVNAAVTISSATTCGNGTLTLEAGPFYRAQPEHQLCRRAISS